MNENELKNKIANDFQSLVSGIAAAETINDTSNPFTRVRFGKDFLEAQLSSPVLSDEELKKITADIDNAIATNKTLKDIVGLVNKGLGILIKYGVLL